MTLDWDGRIRMDPSSSYAMQPPDRPEGSKYDIAFACDTDHDRHGIVVPGDGLMPPNHYLAVAIDYLFRNRPGWKANAAVGKTVVSSAMIDRVTAAPGPQALRGAGRLQMVRRRPSGRLTGLRRRGKRGSVVPAARRQRLDDRQGRHRARAAVGRDDGEDRARPGPALSAISTRDLGDHDRRPGRGAGDRRAEEETVEPVAAAGAHHRNGRRADRAA